MLHGDLCIRIQDQSSIANLLQLETGSWGNICRCFLNIMVGYITLFVPIILPDWQSTIEDPEGVSEPSLSDCLILAWPHP